MKNIANNRRFDTKLNNWRFVYFTITSELMKEFMNLCPELRSFDSKYSEHSLAKGRIVGMYLKLVSECVMQLGIHLKKLQKQKRHKSQNLKIKSPWLIKL